MSAYWFVHADLVEDAYAGGGAPGEYRGLTDARRRADRRYLDPGTAALGLRAGHGPRHDELE
jgi:hypothetical protein